MSVPLTTSKLFEFLGSVYAEIRVLTEENVALSTEVAQLKAELARTEKEPQKQKAK